MRVHTILSSVLGCLVATFGKELLIRLTICSIYILTVCILVISHFGFETLNWVLIASVPGICILFTIFHVVNGHYYPNYFF